MTTQISKSTILHALEVYAKQRPGLDYGDYGNPTIYRAESRQITNDLHDALELLAAVSWRDSITADDLLEAAKRAFSGRLELIQEGDKLRIEYTTGQYFPTEYRKAVSAVLAHSLWQHWRAVSHDGDNIRKIARDELSRRVVRKYFN